MLKSIMVRLYYPINLRCHGLYDFTPIHSFFSSDGICLNNSAAIFTIQFFLCLNTICFQILVHYSCLIGRSPICTSNSDRCNIGAIHVVAQNTFGISRDGNRVGTILDRALPVDSSVVCRIRVAHRVLSYRNGRTPASMRLPASCAGCDIKVKEQDPLTRVWPINGRRADAVYQATSRRQGATAASMAALSVRF